MQSPSMGTLAEPALSAEEMIELCFAHTGKGQ